MEGTLQELSLAVPFAHDIEGNEVLPTAGRKGELYFCPDCTGQLIFRKGEIKKPHFAHKTIPRVCDFLRETEKHYRAKLAVAAAINSRQPAKLIRICTQCRKSIITQPIPPKVKQASLEYTLPSGHRADVALLDEKGQLLAVIEIMETHRVDDDKAKALQDIRWAEFLADSVINSLEWKPDRDLLKPSHCSRCKAIKTYGAVTPFAGKYKTVVQCQMPHRGLVDPIVSCSSCEYFVNVDIEKNGIFCIGGKVNGTGR